ncbi:hypothetical protein COU79_02960 [Candidatus Peregrinibacteria bacterium CG10_big_fil_rev_8_21_14_0_10_54_7]|nr:MAG: hypothetical protein COU79_02960 [Candidatus Peregrinibacteria bacterium CG10_big_fil_rev_8_21_14_0_10_54_7]
MLKQATYAIGHLVTRIALLKPFRHCRVMQQTYALLYGCVKYFFEQREHHFFCSHICEGMTILDVGAHTGYYSCLFSSLVGTHGRVYSFEPDPWSFEVLRNHTRHRENIQQIPSAVGDTVQQSRFFPNTRNRANSSLFPGPFSEDQIEVEMTTIDSFCNKQHLSRIDALKIDVEGAETTVLRGAKNLLTSHPPAWIAIELNPQEMLKGGHNAADLCTFLHNFGYGLHSLSSLGKPVPIGDLPAFIRECTQEYANMIAIRKHPPARKNATLHSTCESHVPAHK